MIHCCIYQRDRLKEVFMPVLLMKSSETNFSNVFLMTLYLTLVCILSVRSDVCRGMRVTIEENPERSGMEKFFSINALHMPLLRCCSSHVNKSCPAFVFFLPSLKCPEEHCQRISLSPSASVSVWDSLTERFLSSRQYRAKILRNYSYSHSLMMVKTTYVVFVFSFSFMFRSGKLGCSHENFPSCSNFQSVRTKQHQWA